MLTPEVVKLIRMIRNHPDYTSQIECILVDFLLEELEQLPPKPAKVEPGSTRSDPTDTKMLDWLEKTESSLRSRGDGVFDVEGSDHVTDDFSTVRAAIREAMRVCGDL